MYTLTGLGQPQQTRGDCSGWEKDRESFSKRVAEHYVRTVLKLGLSAKRIFRYYPLSDEIMEVAFTDDLSVAVSFPGDPELGPGPPAAPPAGRAAPLVHLLLHDAGRPGPHRAGEALGRAVLEASGHTPQLEEPEAFHALALHGKAGTEPCPRPHRTSSSWSDVRMRPRGWPTTESR